MAEPLPQSRELPALSKAEWQVMKCFWRHGSLAARDVYRLLPEGHGWAYKTVKTLLSRLVAKGALDYEQIGNSYLYHAVHSREVLTREELRGFVERVLDGSLAPVLAQFIDQGQVQEGELARLRRVLDEAGRDGAGKRS